LNGSRSSPDARAVQRAIDRALESERRRIARILRSAAARTSGETSSVFGQIANAIELHYEDQIKGDSNAVCDG
jgi:hypothetical protein